MSSVALDMMHVMRCSAVFNFILWKSPSLGLRVCLATPAQASWPQLSSLSPGALFQPFLPSRVVQISLALHSPPLCSAWNTSQAPLATFNSDIRLELTAHPLWDAFCKLPPTCTELLQSYAFLHSIASEITMSRSTFR